MWWSYLVGAGLCAVLAVYLLSIRSGDWIIPFIGIIWLCNSARVAFKEDSKKKNAQNKP